MRQLTMLYRLFGAFSLTVICNTTVYAIDSLPAQAYVHAGEHGQAVLLSRLGECYAVTPAHVIGSVLFATLVGGRVGAPQGDGDLLQTFGYDLSILRLTGALARHCGGELTNVPNLDNVLMANSAASIASVNEDGSLSRRNATVNDVGLLYIRVRPKSSDDQLFKGLSGSLLLVDDIPAGILMSVDPETGEGRALRFDRAVETLRPFFGLSAASVTAEQTVKSQETGSGRQASVISWSSPPLDADSRAANLTDAAGKDTAWYAQAAKFPVELVIELPGDKSQVVNSVVMVGEGVEPKQRLPRDFEILVSNTGRGNWIPVLSGTYFMNDNSKKVSFAPVRARQVMLRIYSHWGDSTAVGLTSLEIPPAR